MMPASRVPRPLAISKATRVTTWHTGIPVPEVLNTVRWSLPLCHVHVLRWTRWVLCWWLLVCHRGRCVVINRRNGFSAAHLLNLFFLSKAGSLRLPSSTFLLFLFLHINDGYSHPTCHSIIRGQLQPGVALYELSRRLSDFLSPLGCRRSHCRHRSWRRWCNGRTHGRLLPSRYMIGQRVRRAEVSRGWIPPSWFQRYRSVPVLLAGQLLHCH